MASLCRALAAVAIPALKPRFSNRSRTIRDLTDSYENWACRNGPLPQVAKLEQQQLLERDPKSRADWL